MSFRTAKARVTGLGSSGEGTHHWWVHRLTSIALIPLFLLWIIPFADALGGGHSEVLALYANPFHAVVAALFVAVSFHHLAQGWQVVIEDYVHAKGLRTAALIANSLVCFALGFAGVFAILKIALAG
ncbi:MAG: succinate dehydrogenase, hydrophobic membrane anchor protein [Pseudomonadota bacterium]